MIGWENSRAAKSQIFCQPKSDSLGYVNADQS